MAEKEEPPRQDPRRPPNRRSAPRPDSDNPRNRQNRIYNSLGVNDLRELLDKKRQERGNSGEGHVPPPDPSYNYLKDPLREKEGEPKQHKKQNQKGHPKPEGFIRGEQQQGSSRGRGQRQRPSHDIENPSNIKVEFSTSTGEHTYTIDEAITLPTIKHVPDKVDHNKPYRGRGRGHGGRGRGRYQTRTVRNNNNPRKLENTWQEYKGNGSGTAAEKSWENDLAQTGIEVQIDHESDQLNEQNVENASGELSELVSELSITESSEDKNVTKQE